MSDPSVSGPSGGANPAPERIIRAIVSGRVQGVGFRAWTQAEAEALGLRGFVRNRISGDVEAVLAGSPQAVETLSRRLWRGPPAARVDRVTITQAGEGDLAVIGGGGFRQIATI
jgi:acylphosphatase